MRLSEEQQAEVDRLTELCRDAHAYQQTVVNAYVKSGRDTRTAQRSRGYDVEALARQALGQSVEAAHDLPGNIPKMVATKKGLSTLVAEADEGVAVARGNLRIYVIGIVKDEFNTRADTYRMRVALLEEVWKETISFGKWLEQNANPALDASFATSIIIPEPTMNSRDLLLDGKKRHTFDPLLKDLMGEDTRSMFDGSYRHEEETNVRAVG